MSLANSPYSLAAPRQEIAEEEAIPAWHVLVQNKFTTQGRLQVKPMVTLSLPPGIQPTLCQRGFHGSQQLTKAMAYVGHGCYICRTEHWGSIAFGDDKLCSTHRRARYIVDIRALGFNWCFVELARVMAYSTPPLPSPLAEELKKILQPLTYPAYQSSDYLFPQLTSTDLQQRLDRLKYLRQTYYGSSFLSSGPYYALEVCLASTPIHALLRTLTFISEEDMKGAHYRVRRFDALEEQLCTYLDNAPKEEI